MREKPRIRLTGMIDAIEELPIPMGRWLLILGSIVVLRHFLEQISGQLPTIYFLSYFLHYPLAYVAPLLGLTIVLAAMSGVRIERVTKLMLFAWLLTLLPPLVDLALKSSADRPELIGYLIPRGRGIGKAFLNLFNPAYSDFIGTTAGIRIEAALGCVLAGVYVHLKTRSAARALLTVVIVYPTMFFFFALPPITLAITRFFGSGLENVYQLFLAKADVHRAFTNVTPFALSDLSNSLVDLFVVAPLLAVWYRMYDAKAFARLKRTIDPVRAAFHVGLTFAGAVLGARLLMGAGGLLSISHPFDAISLAGMLAAAFFTANTATSLALLTRSDGIEHEPELRRAAVFHLACAALFALSVSYVALTYVLAAFGAYYLYYARPFRLARFTPLAGFVMGGVTLFAVELGFSAYAGGNAALWMPPSAVLVALVVPTLALLARDVWETASEREGSYGLEKLPASVARHVAGVAVLLAALVPALAFGSAALAIPGAVAGAGGLIVVVRGRGRFVPAGLAGLGALFLIVVIATGVPGIDTMRGELASTSFSDVTRSSGGFELVGKDSATEQQVELNDGVMLFRSGDYDGAVEKFRRAIEIDPDYTEAYVSIGSAYMRLGRLPEAMRAFRRALSLDETNVTARVGLGQTHKLIGEPESAIEELERALVLDPTSPEASYTLALIYMEAGDIEKERTALELSVANDPGNSLAQSRLADLYMSGGRYEDAVAALKAAQTGRMAVDHLTARLAEAYYAQGDLASAEEYLRREASANPRLASPLANLGRVLAEQGRTDEAVETYRRSLELSSDPSLRARLEREIESLGGR